MDNRLRHAKQSSKKIGENQEKMILPEEFGRLPDLGLRGIETVKQNLVDQGLWEHRLDATAEARRRILGPPAWLNGWLIRFADSHNRLSYVLVQSIYAP